MGCLSWASIGVNFFHTNTNKVKVWRSPSVENRNGKQKAWNKQFARLQIFFIERIYVTDDYSLVSCKFQESKPLELDLSFGAQTWGRRGVTSDRNKCLSLSRDESSPWETVNNRCGGACTYINCQRRENERVARHIPEQTRATSHFHSGEIAWRARKLCSEGSRVLDIAAPNDRRTGLMLRVQIMRMSEMRNKTG